MLDILVIILGLFLIFQALTYDSMPVWWKVLNCAFAGWLFHRVFQSIIAI